MSASWAWTGSWFQRRGVWRPPRVLLQSTAVIDNGWSDTHLEYRMSRKTFYVWEWMIHQQLDDTYSLQTLFPDLSLPKDRWKINTRQVKSILSVSSFKEFAVRRCQIKFSIYACLLVKLVFSKPRTALRLSVSSVWCQFSLFNVFKDDVNVCNCLHTQSNIHKA